MCVEKRREKNARDEKVLLRNRATIAQVITKLNVWLLNRLLELEKATYAIFCFIQSRMMKQTIFSIVSL